MDGYNLDPNMLVSALSNKDNDSLGGGNGLLWIFLLILFWGGNGYGFGGRGQEGNAAVEGQVEAALAKAQASGASDNAILSAIAGNHEAISTLAGITGTNFSQVDSAIRGLERGLCDLGYKNGQDTASILASITSGNSAIASQLAECCCNTQRSIDASRYDMATGFASLSKELGDCCCNTQRAIDGVNYNLATSTATLQNNMDKNFCSLSREVERRIDEAQMENRTGFQSIRDMFVNDKIETLQKEVQLQQFQNSQQAQSSALKEYIDQVVKCSAKPVQP